MRTLEKIQITKEVTHKHDQHKLEYVNFGVGKTIMQIQKDNGETQGSLVATKTSPDEAMKT